ncbi:trypsin-like peptidase domain-containing protein [Azospirillum cavernae]|uniref:trypsin-like peptidase domain-containing protein n=1 Tax=Azospirillum cavernae TaxID=2320860 RepID=UPI0011C4AA9C|nr:trypsin-like peptidase domain-containing protein [Azospirillum cavernae]
MDVTLLVEIFAQANTYDSSLKTGTGYPVGPGRILTARHVLCPGTDSTIKVRWKNHADDAARTWRQATVAWDDEGMDVAVLICDFPDGFQKTYAPVSNIPHKVDARWHSAGFAKCVSEKKDDKIYTKSVGLKGGCYPLNETTGNFDVGVDDATTLPDGWKGISGCPVFVQGSIIGVVVQCPINFDQSRLLAVSARKFFDAPGFRGAILWPEDDARRAAVHKENAEALSLHPKIHQAILAVERIDATATELAGRFFDKSLVDFLDLLQLVCVNLRNARKWNSTVDPKAMCGIVFRTIPLLIEPSVVSLLTQQFGRMIDGDPTAIATRTSAEIAIASFEERDPKFILLGEEAIGGNSIPTPPPAGFEDIGGEFIAAFEKDLIAMLKISNTTGRDEETIRKSINAVLARRARLKSSHYYCIRSNEIGDDEFARNLMKVISNRYDHLRLIRLSADPDHFAVQTAISDGILYFMSIEAGGTP